NGDRAALGLGDLPRARLPAARGPFARRGEARGRFVPRSARAAELRLALDERDREGDGTKDRAANLGRGQAAGERTRCGGGGARKTEAGQLQGRARKRSTTWWGNDESTTDLAKLEWVIEAPAGTEIGVEARHQRAGTLRRRVVLE